MSAVDPIFILKNSTLLLDDECKVVDGFLYERVSFDHLFEVNDFANTDKETYYLEGDHHVYRQFIDVDDYDYVTDPSLLAKLNKEFAGS